MLLDPRLLDRGLPESQIICNGRIKVVRSPERNPQPEGPHFFNDLGRLERVADELIPAVTDGLRRAGGSENADPGCRLYAWNGFVDRGQVGELGDTFRLRERNQLELSGVNEGED